VGGSESVDVNITPREADVAAAMRTYVAFMRAINVGGRAIVKMTDLQAAFAAVGCKNVRTFIQSGNIVFEAREEQAPALFHKIPKALIELFGGEPHVIFRTSRELERLVKSDPFKTHAPERSAKLYVTFLSHKPQSKISFPLVSNAEALEAIAMKNLEVFIISRRRKNGFYGFPNNFIEKELRTSGTTRNWSTLTKIVDLVRSTAV
jgi:uncharacterized protein (DUF1697 family)